MRRLTEGDYRDMARSKGLEWIGGAVPDSVADKTRWRCQRGHEFYARYGNVSTFEPPSDRGFVRGRGCPLCSGRWRKRATDYHLLAKKHGLEWDGKMPANTRDPAKWVAPNGKTLTLSYRSLSSRKTMVSVTGARGLDSDTDTETE